MQANMGIQHEKTALEGWSSCHGLPSVVYFLQPRDANETLKHSQYGRWPIVQKSLDQIMTLTAPCHLSSEPITGIFTVPAPPPPGFCASPQLQVATGSCRGGEQD